MAITTRDKAKASIVAAAVLGGWALFGPFDGAAGVPPDGRGRPPRDEEDTTPPAAVTDLIAEPGAFGSISLRWRTVGDDGGGSDCSGAGTATAYDIRYALFPIRTEADFEAATQADGEPDPWNCGNLQTFCLSGLIPGLSYDVALKVIDEAGNTSALSNVATSLPGDLAGSQMHVSSINVGFSAVGGARRLPWTLVYIYDELGLPVEGAVVTGNFSGCTNDQGRFGVSDCTGFTWVRARKPHGCWGGGSECCFVFTVTDVTHPLYVYDAPANAETCDAQRCDFFGPPCPPCE